MFENTPEMSDVVLCSSQSVSLDEEQNSIHKHNQSIDHDKLNIQKKIIDEDQVKERLTSNNIKKNNDNESLLLSWGDIDNSVTFSDDETQENDDKSCNSKEGHVYEEFPTTPLRLGCIEEESDPVTTMIGKVEIIDEIDSRRPWRKAPVETTEESEHTSETGSVISDTFQLDSKNSLEKNDFMKEINSALVLKRKVNPEGDDIKSSSDVSELNVALDALAQSETTLAGTRRSTLDSLPVYDNLKRGYKKNIAAENLWNSQVQRKIKNSLPGSADSSPASLVRADSRPTSPIFHLQSVEEELSPTYTNINSLDKSNIHPSETANHNERKTTPANSYYGDLSSKSNEIDQSKANNDKVIVTPVNGLGLSTEIDTLSQNLDLRTDQESHSVDTSTRSSSLRFIDVESASLIPTEDEISIEHNNCENSPPMDRKEERRRLSMYMVPIKSDKSIKQEETFISKIRESTKSLFSQKHTYTKKSGSPTTKSEQFEDTIENKNFLFNLCQKKKFLIGLVVVVVVTGIIVILILQLSSKEGNSGIKSCKECTSESLNNDISDSMVPTPDDTWTMFPSQNFTMWPTPDDKS